MSKAAGIAAAVLALAISPILLFFAIGGPPAKAAEPSAAAVADIPADLLPVYREAAKTTCEMDWAILAAIGKIESDHGRSNAPGVHSGANEAGAMGPMQFMPGTWAAYGVDGDHDGTKDVYNSTDAIWGAANNLCANGTGSEDPRGVHDAIYNYNHSEDYVQAVQAQAAAYRSANSVGTGGTAEDLLANPNLNLSPDARKDLEQKAVEQRVINFLTWAVRSHQISVSVLKTGHSELVQGTDRQSNHFFGRAADIDVVDGEAVSPSSARGRAFAEQIAALDQGRPDETGTPWSDITSPGFFSDENHQQHIHAAWHH